MNPPPRWGGGTACPSLTKECSRRSHLSPPPRAPETRQPVRAEEIPGSACVIPLFGLPICHCQASPGREDLGFTTERDSEGVLSLSLLCWEALFSKKLFPTASRSLLICQCPRLPFLTICYTGRLKH